MIKFIKILRSIAFGALVVLGAIAFGVFLTHIMHNLDKQWSIITIICILIGVVAFVDYKLNN
jgi:hypothetical protein